MHQLNINNSGSNMAYVQSVPWNRSDMLLDKGAMTASEAIRMAGLDFTVKMKQVKTVVNRKQTIIPGTYATIRTDTNQVLGVVGSKYQIIQNREAFKFFDPLVNNDEAIYHAIGSIDGGKRLWILAKLPSYIKVGKGDIVNKYLLLTNSHDGSAVIHVKITPIRIVCSNSLNVALRGADHEVKIRHTQNAVHKLEEAHKILGLTNSLYAQLDTIFNRMSLKRISEKQLQDYVRTLIPSNPEAKFQTRNENIREAILDLYETGQGAELSRGSLWGAYNSVTEYSDHVLHSRDQSKQLKSIWFGGGNNLKERAFALAQRMLTN